MGLSRAEHSYFGGIEGHKISPSDHIIFSSIDLVEDHLVDFLWRCGGDFALPPYWDILFFFFFLDSIDLIPFSLFLYL